MTEKLDDIEELPSYLHCPPRSRCRPPVQTRVQELPFGELAWEDFERLCLRLARLEADVVHCQLYGKRGQDQEGIDLFTATRTSPKYRVYQCKREDDFTAGKIKAAVVEFLGGKWVGQTGTFVLCTKEPLVETKRADEVVAQRAALAARGIGFEPWDSHQLNLKLKDHPRLVDDFFGRAWVEAFCGADAAGKLGDRLDAADVAEFRRQLGVFYVRVFEKHDPGLPVPDAITAPPLPLRHRYVVPDVLEHRAGLLLTAPADEDAEPGTGQSADESDPLPDQRGAYDERVAAGEWLASGHNLLLLAGPGGGKSSLLRFVALDLLGDSPRLGPVARGWGSHLPVWVSFPQWTRLIETEGQEPCSLKRLLRLWLRGWDEERLWPLVERAVDDDRLLLLVDGLDEWSSESAARIALDRLRVFAERRNVPSVAVSRPHGFQRLGARPAGWKIARLAGFSRDQQRQLALCWFRFREVARAAPRDADGEQRASREADSLMEELGRSPGLDTLAQTPLLLSLLVYHRMHHVRLPQTRFRAYESLVDHLISVHPQRRLAAASDPGGSDELSGDEIRQALASLACRIQADSGEGLVEADEGVREVERFLRDPEVGLGLGQSEARKLARQLVEVGESNLGLLVRQSPTGVGFLHRTFQEYLAASHLARLPLAEQEQVVERHCGDPRWREVILGLLYCNRRPQEVLALVGKVRGRAATAPVHERLASQSLLAEAAFGDFNCPAGLAQELAGEAFQVIETGGRMPHREALLGHALGGLAFAKVRDLVKAKVQSWFPCWFRYRSDTFEAMCSWPAEPEVGECLWRGLHDEEPGNQRAAARTLARVAGGRSEVGQRVAALARTAADPHTRAAAVDALVRGWPAAEEIGAVLDAARRSEGPEIRLAAIGGRISLGRHAVEDRDDLLGLGVIRTGLHHSWRKEIADLLLGGWPGDPAVKAACLDAVRPHPHERRGIDSDVAWLTLLAGFPGDVDVVEVLRAEFELPHPFLGVLDDFRCWELVIRNFRGNPALDEALERRAASDQGDPLNTARAALVTRTEAAKARLLALLEAGLPYWPAMALLDGWGVEDADVRAKFAEIVAGPPARSAAFAHLFPRVIGDQAECRRRLLSILGDPGCRRPDLALEGLRTLGGPQPDTEAVDAVLKNNPARPDVLWMDRDHCMLVLIRGFHADPRVREIARQQFAAEFPPYTAIAAAFPDDREIRGMLIERLTPLPDRLRLVLAERLPRESPDAAFALGLLGLYDREQDEQVKCQASLSYWGMVKAAGPVGETHLERLGRDILRYGPDLEEQRQAAFCGLATLGRLDIMASARETIGEERICAIGTLARMGQRNAPLVRCILDKWEDIRGTFGAEACQRLNHRHGDWMQMWGHLAPFADAHPAARQDLLRFLSERPERTAGHDTLLFLGRTMPGTRLLLEYCLKALHVGEDGADVGGPLALIAAELLGANFRGDPEVLKAILSGRGGECLYEKTILCLCEGWEKTAAMDRAYEAVTRDERRELMHVTWHRLLCRRGDADAIVRELQSLLNFGGSPPGLSGPLIVRPFVRRIAEDDPLAGRLHQHLLGAPTCSEKASLPRLLVTARGLGDGLRSWCLAELARQQDARSPEQGFDWVAGRVRAVSQSLLDVLEPGVAEESVLPV